mmetsp:Transcript_3882/g.14671  ORF Transcript_3882/g.14671 Transcript_3882/m.14671 type:complete len:90 (+) Transcript_3882:6617-6886(+)
MIFCCIVEYAVKVYAFRHSCVVQCEMYSEKFLQLSAFTALSGSESDSNLQLLPSMNPPFPSDCQAGSCPAHAADSIGCMLIVPPHQWCP